MTKIERLDKPVIRRSLLYPRWRLLGLRRAAGRRSKQNPSFHSLGRSETKKPPQAASLSVSDSWLRPFVLYLFSISLSNVAARGSAGWGTRAAMQVVDLDELKRSGMLWQAAQPAGAWRVLPSGWSGTDELLGGGWPRAALVGAERGPPGTYRCCCRCWCAVEYTRPRWLAWSHRLTCHMHRRWRRARVQVERLLLVREVSGGPVAVGGQAGAQVGCLRVVLVWPRQLQTAQLRRLQLAAEEVTASPSCSVRCGPPGRPHRPRCPACMPRAVRPGGRGAQTAWRLGVGTAASCLSVYRPMPTQCLRLPTLPPPCIPCPGS